MDIDEDILETLQNHFNSMEVSDSEQQPCDECGEEYNEEHYAGCCRDGRCPLEKEFLCTDCGIYCEKLNCILCQMCLENYNAVLEEDKEFIVQ